MMQQSFCNSLRQKLPFHTWNIFQAVEYFNNNMKWHLKLICPFKTNFFKMKFPQKILLLYTLLSKNDLLPTKAFKIVTW